MTNNAFIKYVASTESSLPRLLLTNYIVQEFDTLQSFKGGKNFLLSIKPENVPLY